MNFFNARLMGSKDEMYIQADAFQVKVPQEKIPALSEHLGKDVVFGIRPEDIHDKMFVPVDVSAADLVAKVDVIEPMGSEKYLYLMVDGADFVARVDPRSGAAVGQKLEIALNMDNMHLFDAETEEAIL